MTIATLLCPRCGHNNILNATHCAKCKIMLHNHSADKEETHEEFENNSHPTPLPWLLAGCGFAFIAALLFVGTNRNLPPVPSSVAFFQPVSEPPPEPINPAISTSVVAAPSAPGAVNRPQAEWLPVAEFRGDGASRSRPFIINSPHWRVRWQAKTTNAASNGTKSWFYAFIYRNDGKRLERITNTEAESSKTLRLEKSGTYYVDVNATQDWSLKIEEWR